MADIKNLIRQHHEMLDLATKISAYKNEQQIADNAFNIAMLIGQLAGKLKVHTTTEDKFVYPALLNHTDKKIQDVSRDFANEMGDLSRVFENYKTKYISAKQIAANPNHFISETKLVFTALARRIEKENTQLYPLLS